MFVPQLRFPGGGAQDRGSCGGIYSWKDTGEGSEESRMALSGVCCQLRSNSAGAVEALSMNCTTEAEGHDLLDYSLRCV